MFRVALVSTLLAVAACPPTDGVKPCTGNADCSLRAGGVCLASPLGTDQCAYPDPACASGLSWGELSTDIAGQCVTAIDAGVDAIDAIDAPIDAPPSMPIIVDYQTADLVIGQTSFTTLQDRGFAAASVQPTDIAATPEGLWVTDDVRNRVLYFSPLPSLGDPAAALVVGRPSPTDSAVIGSPSATNLGASLSVAAGGGRLLVVDRERNRVLVWNTVPAASGVPADLVLGQPDMTSSSPGSGAGQLASPHCAWTDGIRVAVCDANNHRVLLWNNFPASNGAPADVVLGQSSFGSSTDPVTPSASNLSWPRAITYDGAQFYVTDLAFRRVLVWSGFPNTNGAAASFVLGQALFSEQRSVQASPIYTRAVSGIGRYRDALLAADSGHARIVVWQPMPVASGSSAALVLGQPDLVSSNAESVPNQRTFRGLNGISTVGDKLFVADFYNRRVLRFTFR